MKPSSKKSFVPVLFWTMIFVIISFIGITTLTLHHSSIVLRQWLEDMSVSFMLVRWGIMIIVFLSWPRLMQVLGKRNQWSEEYVIFVSGQRYKLFIWFVVLELILGENIIGRFFQLFFS